VSLDRRELLAGGGALVASCASGAGSRVPEGAASMDALLEANADVLPEAAGSGANHYPMAAEALEALGHPGSIEDAWRSGAARYAASTPGVARITEPAEALGDWRRYGDWLDLFRGELAREPWNTVVARWTPLLAPGVSAAVFHGLIRTAHAVRGLRRSHAPARTGELAVGLAYWAARYAELPVADDLELGAPLATLSHPRVNEDEDVSFDAASSYLVRAPIAPRVKLADGGPSATDELDELVRESAAVFLEMLVQERQRIWLLHTVTGPAAAALLVPELEARDARTLAAYCRQAVVALYVAFGAPCIPLAHLRDATPWPELLRRAAGSRSVHTIKLVEALYRQRHVDDALCRSVAAQWFEWT